MPILIILFPVSMLACVAMLIRDLRWKRQVAVLLMVVVLGGVMSAMCFEIGRIDATYRLNVSARKLVRGTSAALTHGTRDEVRAAFTEAVSRVDAVAPVTGESTR